MSQLRRNIHEGVVAVALAKLSLTTLMMRAHEGRQQADCPGNDLAD